VAPATYYENVDKAIWDMIHDTHGLVPTLLQTKTLRTSLQPNQIYVTDEAGTVIKNKYNSARYNDEYANKYTHCFKRNG
jgi:hypothetical protein